MGPWICLIIAGLLEVVWATAMKKSDGFTKVIPSIVTIVAMIVSFGLLASAMKQLPLSISYTVWVGIGAVGSAIMGVVWYGERLNAAQWVCMALIAAGIVGLKVMGSRSKNTAPAVKAGAAQL